MIGLTYFKFSAQSQPQLAQEEQLPQLPEPQAQLEQFPQLCAQSPLALALVALVFCCGKASSRTLSLA